MVELSGSTLGQAGKEHPYPDIADIRNATPEAVKFFSSFFTAKSRYDVDGTMAHFSPDMVTYTDATLGWFIDGFQALKDLFTRYMPGWSPSGLSYPTRILGSTESAVVAFTDTPELFGGELRILGVVDSVDGKIVRWVDYWDSCGFDSKLYDRLRTPLEKFPPDLHEKEAASKASVKIQRAARRLQDAFSAGDAAAAIDIFAYDAVYEDMALRTQVLGRAAIGRYLKRILTEAPYGSGSGLRHVVGGDYGGGFEWAAAPHSALKFGVTALELDARGSITRLTVVYDGRALDRRRLDELTLLSRDEF